MHKIIVLILIFVNVQVFAQDTITYGFVNEKTYNYYMSGDWKNVCRLGMKGLKNDIDYYYLRARLGKSWFERENYVKASKHFRKALEYNSADPFAIEYLYYSMINLGERKEASLLRSRMSNELIEYMKLKNNKPFISDFFFEIAAFNNPDFEEQSVISLDDFPIGAKRTLTDNFLNITMLAGHPLSKRFDYVHAITLLSLNGLEQSRPVGSPGFFPPAYIEDKQSVSQTQYFSKLVCHLSAKDNLAAGGHFLTSTTRVTRGGRNGNITQTRERNIAFFADYQRTFSIFKANIFLAKANLNLDKQYQGTATLLYYPFGNLNLYGSTELTVINEDDSINKLIMQQMFGCKVYKNLWIEGSFMKGEIKNYLDKGGLIVYNNTNTITSKIEGSIILNFPEAKIKTYLKYLYMKNTGDNMYSPISETNPEDYSYLNKTRFNTQTITGGIVWNF